MAFFYLLYIYVRAGGGAIRKGGQPLRASALKKHYEQTEKLSFY